MLIPNSIGKRPKEQNEVRGNIVRMENPKVVSLFSGCGGLDLGLIKAGYRIVWANDCMPEHSRDLQEQHRAPHNTWRYKRDRRRIYP